MLFYTLLKYKSTNIRCQRICYSARHFIKGTAIITKIRITAESACIPQTKSPGSCNTCSFRGISFTYASLNITPLIEIASKRDFYKRLLSPDTSKIHMEIPSGFSVAIKEPVLNASIQTGSSLSTKTTSWFFHMNFSCPARYHSSSTVPGGLLVRSNITRLTPLTSLMMRLITF